MTRHGALPRPFAILDAATVVQVPAEYSERTTPRRRKAKDCYRQACLYLIYHRLAGMRLMHGSVTPFDFAPGLRIGHAWVEMPYQDGTVVFDGVCQQFYDRDSYYAVLSAQVERDYEPKAAKLAAYQASHYGPWHEPDYVERLRGQIREGAIA